MKRGRKPKPAANPLRAAAKVPVKKPARKASLALLALGLAIVVAVLLHSRSGNAVPAPYVHRPPHTLTFNKDIAPIIFDRCAYCHRPSQAAPFALLSYADVKKRAKQIAEVTARRYMPPWLLEPGYGEFADARSLTPDQLGALQQWLTEGAVEGNPADMPPSPKWAGEWTLGEPDLIVKLPQPYVLPAEGKDVYRNLVLPIPMATPRFVKGVEFLSGNAKVVHHAFINVDETRQSRRL